MDNEIAILSPVRPDGQLSTLYRPEKPVYVGDLKLHFDAEQLLFSSVGSHERWQIFEIGIDGSRLRQVTRGTDSDIDNYDSCYLPDGRVLFASSACFQSVPCERRCDEVANFCVMNADGSDVRRLCFDQDHNFYPSVMADGRILYTRWEYTDIAHAFTGRLMTMNPDGTGQRAPTMRVAASGRTAFSTPARFPTAPRNSRPSSRVIMELRGPENSWCSTWPRGDIRPRAPCNAFPVGARRSKPSW